MTDRTSASPNELYGGILADEMGLGKTLTMLSTIAITQSQSRTFAKGHGSDENSSAKPLQATMVLVPSACKYFCTMLNSSQVLQT